MRWTDEEKEFLRDNAHNMTVNQLCDNIRKVSGNYRSLVVMRAKLTHMGLCAMKEERRSSHDYQIPCCNRHRPDS